MENQTEKTGVKNSIVKKLFMIIAFLLLLIIPLAFVENTVKEREKYRNEAATNVKSAWASEQVIQIPTLEIVKGTDLQLGDLNVESDVQTQIRKKGIFKIPIYNTTIKMTGTFLNPSHKDINGEVFFPITDVKGLSEKPVIKVNGVNYSNDEANSAKINIKNAPKVIYFENSYKLKGSDAISFQVGAKTNKINVKSNWKDPDFNGNFLPIERKVDNSGFSAQWSVPKIAVSEDSSFCKISFLTPVDNYRMTIRTVKYGFLFLSLTFLAFFIFEITRKNNPIHPFQYGLVGISMIIFYLLLISMSELLPFWLSYIAASLMTIALISGYTYFVLSSKNKKFSALIATILAVLYSYLYTILNLQDYALLLGSFGLFITVLLVMYVTRNIDWYGNQ